MKLIIAEKPELAKAIAEAIEGKKTMKQGYIEVNDYCITWAAGHLLEFKKPEDVNEDYKKWNLNDLPIVFKPWGKKVIKGKEGLLSNIRKLIKDADEVINAGDPDDEGQYLIDEIIAFLGYKGKVNRILINDNNKEAIKKAFKNIQSNNKFLPLGMAAEARSLSDLLIGINLSRFFTLYHNSGKILSVGRVQTPTLQLVVKRDDEIKNHIKEKYYEIYSLNDVEGNNIKLKLQQKKDDKVTDKEIFNNMIKNIKGKSVNIVVTKKKQEENPPLPFNLANLQIEANKKFGYSVQKTQDITQSLREKHKAITYNRSDCEYLSEEHYKEAPNLLPKVLNKLNLNGIKVNSSKKSAAFNDSYITAHHAIIPTGSGDISSFSEEEKKVYSLIAQRYIIQFMENRILEKTEAMFEIEGKVFKSASNKTISKGYLEIYGNSDEQESDISKLKEGNYNNILNEFKIDELETQAKKYYTEASLLKDMTSISKYVKNEEIKEILKRKDKDKKGENGSIGTPATRAAIINNLFNRGYLVLEGKNIKSTELAREYLKTLPDILKEADMTALWWTIQEDIKEDKATKEKLIDYVLKDINTIINTKYDKLNINSTSSKQELKDGDVIEINTKNGKAYKAKFKGEEVWINTQMKYFDNELKITKSIASNLAKGKAVEFELKYKDKIYKQKLKLVKNGKYLNFEKA